MTTKPPFVRTPYNYDMNKAGDEDALRCKDPSLTKQSFADECDINTIVERFNVTGQLPTNVRMPTYADFTNTFDFHSAMTAIRTAQEAFDAMPAKVRARFHNDPAEFVDFCADKENLPEATRLGLVSAEAIAKAQALLTGEKPPEPSLAAPEGTKPPPSTTPPQGEKKD